MNRVSDRTVTAILVGLTLVAVALTVYMVATSHHQMDPIHYAPAIILVLVTIAWPFANGWRPFTPKGMELHACGTCGAQWRPNEEGGSRFCPACGNAQVATKV